ncbi:MAG: leucine-rich repeat protein [Lachnospiraceae bacterium]|nr:leucine-rich repeat protein [Lachnospiraceae bacterium]
MEGLSPIKKYNFFLKGADGSAIAYRNNYIIKSDEPENDKPDDNKPDDNDNTNNNPGSGTGIIIPYPSVPTGAPGTTATPVPGVTPEATATPVPSVTPEISGSPAPTAVPEASGSPQESAIPEVSAAPVETVAPEVSGTPVPGETESTKNNIKKGTKTVDKKSKAIYKVTKTGKNKTAEYIESTKQKPVNVTIPNSVKINGSVYKVTSVGADAFKNNKKLKSVQIGKNVISIGKKAFYGCKKLRTITVRTNKLKSASIGKNAFGNGFSSPQVKAVKSKWKLYKKIFQAKGMSKKSKFKKL